MGGGGRTVTAALVAALLLVTVLSSPSGALASPDHGLAMGWIPTRSGCQGSIAECLAGDEFDMDTEISRRILAISKYISYGALRRNSVPCSVRGASYYNCRPGAAANPYTRGCSAITRCRTS